MKAKKFPVICGKFLGYANSTKEAWAMMRKELGHADFEAYFDSASLTFKVYLPTSR